MVLVEQDQQLLKPAELQLLVQLVVFQKVTPVLEVVHIKAIVVNLPDQVVFLVEAVVLPPTTPLQEAPAELEPEEEEHLLGKAPMRIQ
jgi:hypothetical protein